MAGALDSGGQLTLMLSACTGDTAGKNLRTLGDELLQTNRILVVDVIDLVSAEQADFLSSAVEGALSGTLCSCFGSLGFGSLLGSGDNFGSFVIPLMRPPV